MEKHERSDPTFAIIVVLAFIFLGALIYVTFPRQEAPAHPSSSSAPQSPSKK
jgi:hypothetical protein